MDDQQPSTTRVLIVDDEPAFCRALADNLTDVGYVVDTAADGTEGMSKASAVSYDVVLVDLRMPNVHGLEVIEALGADQPRLPVVAISGAGVVHDVVEAMRQGAWDYIAKPTHDASEIVVVIERVLERARLLTDRDRYRQELEDLNRSLEAEVARQMVDLINQNRELAALNRVSYAISDPLDIDTMLGRAIDAAVAALEADGGVVRLLNPDTSQLVIAAARGLPDSYLGAAQAIPFGQGVIGGVARTGHPNAGRDLSADPWLALLQEEAFQAYLCVPLRAGDEGGEKHPVVGTLGVVSRRQRAFDAREVDLLATIGNQIGVALARARYATDLSDTNVQLERANAELRRLDTLREQFIQNVAHELRTPLALVRGYIEMLSLGDLDPEEQRTALDVAARRVQVLVELVEAITTLQNLGSQSLYIESVAPADLLRTVLQMSGQRCLSTNIDMRIECPPDLVAFPGDFTRLAQALYQLVDNACKFSPEGSAVAVRAGLAPEENAVAISVTDQGIGIPPEEHEHIFERFYQIDGSAARRYGGTGLGLALVNEIVSEHGGRVSVESEPGAGSTFTMFLPLERSGGETDQAV